MFDSDYAQQPQCYNGKRYSWMAACEQCTGPGPSQCTKCTEGYALIPWRIHEDAMQGSCRTFDRTGIVLQSVEGGTPISTKWGVQQDLLMLPAADGIYNEKKDAMVRLEIQCLVLKYVWCKHSKQEGSKVKSKCMTRKSVQLYSVPYIAFDHDRHLVKKAYHELGLSQIKGKSNKGGFKDLPLEYLTEFVSIPSLDSPCTNIIKLL